MKILDTIQRYEKDFIAAGKLACDLRKSAISSNKFETGDSLVDIVTTADLEVQEYILTLLARSELKNCELIAEEDTPSIDKFAKTSKYVLTLDPIDGTRVYADGNKMFSVVVTIHDKKRPLYTFCFYPAVNWGIKIVENKLEYIGKKPKIKTVSKIPPKSIIYFDRMGKLGPQKQNPQMYEKLTKQGYKFVPNHKVSIATGIKAPFLLGEVSGTFIENGAAVDSLTEMHFGLASNFKIYSNYDLSKPVQLPGKDYLSYKGNIFVIRPD